MGNIGGVHGGDKPGVEDSEAVSRAQLAAGGSGGEGAPATDGAPGAKRTARPRRWRRIPNDSPAS